MTDFLENEMIRSDVGAFPIHEYWLDIGQIDEYEKANLEVKNIFPIEN